MLKGQDLLVAIKLVANPGLAWTYAVLGGQLGLSTSETRYAVQRAMRADLVSARTRNAIRPAVRDFLLHGARYAFAAELGRRVRGVATATSAPPLSGYLAADQDLVWHYSQGAARGQSVSPIYRSVPLAASKDPKLHELLALLDGIRLGGPRVRKVAQELLAEQLA